MTQNIPSYPESQGGQYQYRPVEKGGAPSQVRTAVGLMLLNSLIGLVGVVVLFASRDTIKRRTAKDNPDYSTHKIDTAVNAFLAVFTVIDVVFLVLYALLAWQVSKGKQWARIVAWVLNGLGIIVGLSGLGGDASGGSKALSVVGIVLNVAIVLLLIAGGKGGYFRTAPPSDPNYGGYPPPAYPPPR